MKSARAAARPASALGPRPTALPLRVLRTTRVVVHLADALLKTALVDPTGCGDAYRAGLLYGIARQWDWERTGRLAAILGSVKIASQGGQNHALDRDTVAAIYAETFTGNLW